MMARKRVAILISGRGSNMMSLIEAARDPAYPAEIDLVISNRADAAGVERARAAGVTATVIPSRAYEDRAAFEVELTRQLEAAHIEIVCLAGFMRVLTAGFVAHWHDRLINIHPSLLPAFKGLDTHARALAAGAAEHGCTVHYVRADVDDGPVIAQAKVPVFADDTAEILAARVLAEEHKLYPAALALVAAGAAAA
jgi:formyltetrahydrofolate-dependent phosphoribosylglycinamide formyltransferase